MNLFLHISSHSSHPISYQTNISKCHLGGITEDILIGTILIATITIILNDTFAILLIKDFIFALQSLSKF